MLKTDLVCVRLRLRQEGDFGAFHRFDIPRHMGDQWDYVDGALTRNHLLPMSKHALDGCWRFLCPIRIDILQAHRITAVALHLAVFQGIVFFLREALW